MTDNVNNQDIEILRKETGLGQIEAERLMEECGNDVVSAILKHEGVKINEPKPKPLTEAQQKIAELRAIVDEKDQKMDAIIQQGKAQTS
jgi:N-acetylmuramic acid 6-phosphate (MurNAc-6-P) etherase